MLVRIPQTQLVNGVFTDGGPLYRETNPAATIAEPFNAATALLFFIIAVYWCMKLRGRYREFGVLSFCLAVLAIGGIGGTLFHGLRVSRIFYLMDVLPIGIVILTLSAYLWKLSTGRWGRAVTWMVAATVIQSLVFNQVGRQFAISVSYCVMALLVLVPLFLLLRRQRYANAWYVAACVACFAVAVTFRTLDPFPLEIFPMGTHWLWHVFSAAAVVLLTTYVFRAVELAERPNNISTMASSRRSVNM